MTDIKVLKIAAITAVIATIGNSDDPSQIGRKMGESWAHDHRRMNMGMSSLMHKKSSRSTWR
ncbi:MAG: hypothetical protein QGI21_01515 [Candidatus Poseidoniaceae archaeon]|jgi:hypothetical protein|nr:hypothetical protein [Candidatus Poseidoniaceae archaeon]